MPAEIMAENTATNGGPRKQYGQYLLLLLTRLFCRSLLLRSIVYSCDTYPSLL